MRAFGWIVIGVIFALPISATAQALQFGSAALDPSAPLEISSDSLSIDETTNSAELSGSVFIQQGAMALAADQLRITYGADSDLRSFAAKGAVRLENPPTVIQADEAFYDFADEKIRLTGNVAVINGDNRVSAQTMAIDLRTGQASLRGQVRSQIKLAPKE